MMFALRTESLEVRGQRLTVSELTSGARVQWVRTTRESPDESAPLLVSLCLLEPTATVDDVKGWPAEVLDEVAEAIMRVSGMEKAEGDGGKNA